MKYTNLGCSGLKVSRVGLGCMSFGVETRAWRLDEAASRLVIRHALEQGITHFDTADMYGAGESETVLGRALADFARRDEVVIATKLFYPVRVDPNGRGLSRKAIFAAIDASLVRLGTDHIDLYQVHRWDDETPDRGDDGCLERHRSRRKGAVSWRIVDVRLASRESAGGCCLSRIGKVRIGAATL